MSHVYTDGGTHLRPPEACGAAELWFSVGFRRARGRLEGRTAEACGEAELWFSVGFLCLHALPKFHKNFTGLSPESHQNHQNFARVSNRSTLKKENKPQLSLPTPRPWQTPASGSRRGKDLAAAYLLAP